jgi:hypothetical protein
VRAIHVTRETPAAKISALFLCQVARDRYPISARKRIGASPDGEIIITSVKACVAAIEIVYCEKPLCAPLARILILPQRENRASRVCPPACPELSAAKSDSDGCSLRGASQADVRRNDPAGAAALSRRRLDAADCGFVIDHGLPVG